ASQSESGHNPEKHTTIRTEMRRGATQHGEKK
ncbi:hypothetical protein P3T39_006134, partial [Kitasatospora sp. GP82]|nr:hypothetical protein [Kitasatospora sp. GP82]